MSAYLIGRMMISDPATYDRYKEHTPAAVTKYGGRFVSRGGKVITLEGETETRRVVIVEFPSLEDARAFYDSAEYQKARNIRQDAAYQMQLIAVEGFE